MKLLRELLTSFYAWLYIQCIARFVLLRPRNLTINGKLRADFGSQLSLDRSSQFSINGDLTLRKSKLIIRDSHLCLYDAQIDSSNIYLLSSEMFAQSGLHLIGSLARINKSKLSLDKEFRIFGVPIFLDSSTLTAGRFGLIQQQLHYAPRLRLTQAKVTTGENVNLQCDLLCEGSLFEVGNNVFINYGTEVRCFERVTIGNNVFVSYECILFDTNTHSTDADKRLQEIHLGFPNSTRQASDNKPDTKAITIGSNSWIGMRAAVLKGAVIEESAIVGIGAVVTGTVPKGHIAVGNPYVIKKIDKTQKQVSEIHERLN